MRNRPGEAIYIFDQASERTFSPTRRRRARPVGPIRGAARPGLQRLQRDARQAGRRADTDRRSLRSGEDLAAGDPQRRPGPGAAAGSTPMPSGCSAPIARKARRPSCLRSTRRAARSWRAIPTASNSPTASRSSPATAAPQTVTCDRAEFIGTDGSAEWPACVRTGAALSGVGRGRTRSLRGDRARHRGRARRRDRRSPSCSAMPVRREEASALVQKHRAARFRRAPRGGASGMGRLPRHHRGRDTGRGLQRAGQPLAALPEPGLPHPGTLGLLPGERRVRLPRPAAGHAGLPASTTRRSPASRSSRQRRGSSRKATCSIGGCRAPAPACAR